MMMLEPLHLAAQYPAMAGKSFLAPKADDSHTNLGWNVEKSQLLSRTFGTGHYQLGINCRTFSVDWLEQGQTTDQLPLNGSTHRQLLNWISDQANEKKIGKAYTHRLHYDLPYGPVTPDYTYRLTSEASQEAMIVRFNQAQACLANFLAETGIASELRVWPHHFDLGFYGTLAVPGTQTGTRALGVGMAVPDRLGLGFYYYVSGWNEAGAVSTANMPPLDRGTWHNEGFKGATLGLEETGISDADIRLFLQQAFQSFSI